MMSFRSNRNSNSNRNRNQLLRSTTKRNEKHFTDVLNDSSNTVRTDTDTDLDLSDHSAKNNNSCCQQQEYCVPVPAVDIVHLVNECVLNKSEDEETETQPMKRKKNVRFSTVNIREYSICLGDNPSVARGAPISLDWYYENEISIDLDEYEQHNRKRDHNSEFKRPSLERLHLLKHIGYSRIEIVEATRQVEKIRHQRFQTRRQLQRMDAFRSFFFWKKATTESNQESTTCSSSSSSTVVVSERPKLLHRDSLKLPTKKKKKKMASINSVAQQWAVPL